MFDDPASSVDHRHRERIAKRIAKESLARQVIVFTHDPVFLHDLQTNTAALNASMSVGFVQWNKDIPGEWTAGLPWKWKSPAERFDLLRKEQQTLPVVEDVQVCATGKANLKAHLRVAHRIAVLFPVVGNRKRGQTHWTGFVHRLDDEFHVRGLPASPIGTSNRSVSRCFPSCSEYVM